MIYQTFDLIITKLPAIPDGCPDIRQWVSEQILGSNTFKYRKN